MAAPSKVEFPGQKKQRVRMRGTKHANEATANRIKRELAQLLESPAEKLPQMMWKGRLRWGRTDPVTKTMNELNKIIKKKKSQEPPDERSSRGNILNTTLVWFQPDCSIIRLTEYYFVSSCPNPPPPPYLFSEKEMSWVCWRTE